MRVTTADTTTKVYCYVVPERYIQRYPGKERQWVPSDEHRVQVDSYIRGSIESAVTALQCDVDANLDYWGEYRFVLVRIDTVQQVLT